MNDSNKLLQQIELELAQELIEAVRKEKISLADAKKIALDFNSLKPLKDVGGVLNALKLVCETHNKGWQVFFNYGKEFQDLKDKETLKKMRELMSQKEWNKALETAKGGQNE